MPLHFKCVKAEGFTAIKSWVIGWIAFVFGAMLEYSVILLLLMLEKMNVAHYKPYRQVINGLKRKVSNFPPIAGPAWP